jgi:transcriptional antiterminator
VREKLTTYERRESIKSFLLRERKTTAAYLADMFNVSRQTIVNDMVFWNFSMFLTPLSLSLIVQHFRFCFCLLQNRTIIT